MAAQPEGLTVEHELTDDCPCNPKVIPVKREDGSIGWVIVHNR